MESYVYEKLPIERSIRLLRLHPGSSVGRIRVSLRVVSLDEYPPYCAISYTWNGTTRTNVVECDEMEIKISSGSYCVLEKIRDGEYKDEELWIDALCIDQSDVVERGSQVRLMKAIYSNAKMTL